ncbi:hypothetical protein, partial [Acinetobacter baumannii]|uniref:hypothetical protein n=1 Tax=Acinetobacter baumannii TaxID=470 RepID=UPI003399FA8F
ELRAFRDTADRPCTRFNTQRLKETSVRENFAVTTRNRFDDLTQIAGENTNSEKHWEALRYVRTASCHAVLGKKTRTSKEWISSNTWDLIQERKNMRQKLLSCVEHEADSLKREYQSLNAQVKKGARRDKRLLFNALATEAEQAAARRDLSTLYKVTRTLSARKAYEDKPVKGTEGKP